MQQSASTENAPPAVTNRRISVASWKAGPHVRKQTVSTMQSQRAGLCEEWDICGRKLGAPLEENTYRLEPKPQEKFNASTAQRIMADFLERHLDGERYDQCRCRNLSKSLADAMVHHMKDQGFSQHYKYVCFVTIGQKKPNQAMQVCSRCLWNDKTDNYASVSYSRGDLFAVAVVYATYRE